MVDKSMIKNDAKMTSFAPSCRPAVIILSSLTTMLMRSLSGISLNLVIDSFAVIEDDHCQLKQAKNQEKGYKLFE